VCDEDSFSHTRPFSRVKSDDEDSNDGPRDRESMRNRRLCKPDGQIALVSRVTVVKRRVWADHRMEYTPLARRNMSRNHTQ
jgi:hypothetical protein